MGLVTGLDWRIGAGGKSENYLMEGGSLMMRGIVVEMLFEYRVPVGFCVSV